MSGQRQKNRPEQGVLAFAVESRSDAPKAAAKGVETLMAKHKTESLAGTERLMEEVCEMENCKQASKDLAAQTAGSPHGPWRIANSPALAIALPNAYFAKLGLPPMVVRS
jgi:hypothetical protein